MRSRRAKLTSLVAVLAVVGGLSVLLAGSAGAVPGPPTTTLGVQPTEVAGNPTCASLIDAEDFLFEFRQEPVQDATVPLSFDGLTGTLVIDVQPGQLFDFSFTGDFAAAAVFVKGGPRGNLYVYSPPATADTGLHAPVNPQNGQFFGLSHISFCIAERARTGAIEIAKTVKVPGGGQQPLAGAKFTIDGQAVTTDANGKACVDELAFGTYTVTETEAPPGYALADPASQQVVVDQEGSCDPLTTPETVSFENVPLTDLDVTVTAQVPGATLSTIECNGSSSGTPPGTPADPATLSVDDLPPGTYTCEIVIDP